MAVAMLSSDAAAEAAAAMDPLLDNAACGVGGALALSCGMRKRMPLWTMKPADCGGA